MCEFFYTFTLPSTLRENTCNFRYVREVIYRMYKMKKMWNWKFPIVPFGRARKRTGTCRQSVNRRQVSFKWACKNRKCKLSCGQISQLLERFFDRVSTVLVRPINHERERNSSCSRSLISLLRFTASTSHPTSNRFYCKANHLSTCELSQLGQHLIFLCCFLFSFVVFFSAVALPKQYH